MRLSLTEYFLSMAVLVAKRSSCLKRQVGCVITDSNNYVIATGYNGPPKGLEHCKECLKDSLGPSFCRAIHAEQNALLQCDCQKINNIYVTCSPCYTCGKLIANTSAKNVIAIKKDTGGDKNSVQLFKATKQKYVQLDYVVPKE